MRKLFSKNEMAPSVSLKSIELIAYLQYFCTVSFCTPDISTVPLVDSPSLIGVVLVPGGLERGSGVGVGPVVGCGAGGYGDTVGGGVG